jgi:hypothetical protein
MPSLAVCTSMVVQRMLPRSEGRPVEPDATALPLRPSPVVLALIEGVS